jgi:hypothetical protein
MHLSTPSPPQQLTQPLVKAQYRSSSAGKNGIMLNDIALKAFSPGKRST